MNRSTPSLLYFIILSLLATVTLLSSEAYGDQGVYRVMSRETICPDGTCPIAPGFQQSISQGSAVAIGTLDGYGWFVTAGHVIKQDPVVNINNRNYRLQLEGSWYNASLEEKVLLIRTSDPVPSSSIKTFDISPTPLALGDQAHIIGFPAGRYAALNVTIKALTKAGYITGGELGYPGISGGGLVSNRHLYGIVTFIDRKARVNLHHDITLIRDRIAAEHPGVLPGSLNNAPIPTPANPQQVPHQSSPVPRQPQEPIPRQPQPQPDHPSDDRDIPDLRNPGDGNPQSPLPVNPPVPVIPPAQVTPPRYRPFVPPPEPWPDQPLVIPPENHEPPPKHDNRVLPWIRERASEVPWWDIGTLVLLGATGAGGGLLGWKGLMAGGRLLSSLMKSRPRPPTPQVANPPVFIPSSSESKTENRFIVREVDFMGEAYKEALRRTSTIEPRAIDVLKQVEHVAQEIIRGRNVSDRPKKSPQSGIWSDPSGSDTSGS